MPSPNGHSPESNPESKDKPDTLKQKLFSRTEPQPEVKQAFIPPTPKTETKAEAAPKARKEKKNERRKTANTITFENKRFHAELKGTEIISRSHSTSDTNTTTVNLKTPTVLEQLPEMNFKVSKEILTAPSGNKKTVYKYHADGSGSTDTLRLEEQDLIAKEMEKFAQKIKEAKAKNEKPCLDAIWIGDFNTSPYEYKNGEVKVNEKFLDMLKKAFPGGVFNIGLPSYAVIKTRGALENGEDLGLSPLNQQSEKDGERNFDAKSIVIHIKFNEDGEVISRDPKKMVEDKIKAGVGIKTFDGDYTGLKDHPYSILEDEDIVYASWGNMSTQGFKGFSKPCEKYVDSALENGNLTKATIDAGVKAVREFAFLLSQKCLPIFNQIQAESKMDEKQAAAFDKYKKDFTIVKDVNGQVPKVSVPFSKAFTYVMTAKRKELDLESLENTKKELEKKKETPDFTTEDKNQLDQLVPKIKEVELKLKADKELMEGLLIDTLKDWFKTDEFKAMKATLKTKFGDTEAEQTKFIKKVAEAMYKVTKAPIDPFLKELDGQTTAGYMPWVNNIKEAIDNALVDVLQAESTARLINEIRKSGKVGYLVETEAFVAKECLFYEMPDDAFKRDLEAKEEDRSEAYFQAIAGQIAKKINEHFPDNDKQLFVLYDDELYYINAGDACISHIPCPATPEDLKEYNSLKAKCVSGPAASLVTLGVKEQLDKTELNAIKEKKRLFFIKNVEENAWSVAHYVDGSDPVQIQETPINHQAIIQLLEFELNNNNGKDFIKNTTSLLKLNEFLTSSHLPNCNDMTIKNANKLDVRDKDAAFNISGVTVQGSKDKKYTETLTKALTKVVGTENTDEKSSFFQLNKQVAPRSELSQENKTEALSIHLPAVENVTPPAELTTQKAPPATQMVIQSLVSQEQKEEVKRQPLEVDSPRFANFSRENSVASSSSGPSNLSSSSSSSNSPDQALLMPNPWATLTQTTVTTASIMTSANATGIAEVEIPRIPGILKIPKAANTKKSPNFRRGKDSVSSSPQTGMVLPNTGEFKETSSFLTESKTTGRLLSKNRERLSMDEYDPDNSFPDFGAFTLREESPVRLKERYFSQTEMSDIKPRPVAGLVGPNKNQANQPIQMQSPANNDNFPEITRFKVRLEILRKKSLARTPLEQWEQQCLKNFLKEFDTLNLCKLSKAEYKDLRHLCLHVQNTVYKENQLTLSPEEDLEDLEILVPRLSNRPNMTRVLLAAAVLILGCAALCSLAAIGLGIPAVAAFAGVTAATYTSLSSAALIGIGSTGVLVSTLIGLSLFSATTPKLKGLAKLTDTIEDERIALDNRIS